ncbi:NB-ARC domain-containing protein [Streptomyces sp. NPDC054834]
MQTLARPRLVSWPHQIGIVPPQADCFQHRDAADALDRALAGHVAAASAGPAATRGCLILVGAGGVGKTQLVAQYARRMWHSGDIDLLVWLSASTPEAIVDAYAQAARRVLDLDHQGPGQAAEVFLTWLGQDHGKRWLVVLDDVTQPADVHDLWPPHVPGGRTLVTTRNRDAAFLTQDRAFVEVGLFTPEESHAYLSTKLSVHQRHDSAGQISALAEDFGHLPLALAQAVPYMVNKHLDCAAYRQRLADRRLALPDVLPDIGGLPDGQRHTVAAAWSLSVDLADRLNPPGLARPLLQMAAMLDPNGIPGPVLDGGPALGLLSRDRATTVDFDDVTCALWNLHQLSLIDHTPEVLHRAVRVHQLIQRAVREPLPPDRYRLLARTAADALADAWPDRERDIDLARALRANTEVLNDHAEGALYQPRAHGVLYRCGHSLGEGRQIGAAADHFARLATGARRHLGDEHPDALQACHDSAVWRGRAGDAKGAAKLFAELLVPTLRALGDTHPQSFTVWRNLIDWREAAGDTAGATAAGAGFLDHLTRVLGPDHPLTRAQQRFAR